MRCWEVLSCINTTMRAIRSNYKSNYEEYCIESLYYMRLVNYQVSALYFLFSFFC